MVEEIKEKESSIFKTRFKDAIWFDKMNKDCTILLIGAGGIGSFSAFALSRIGCNLIIYDDDTYSGENLAGQLACMNDIGIRKTESIKRFCLSYSGNENIISTEGMYTETSYTNEIVITALDNMEGRKLAFYKWLDYLNEVPEEYQKNFIFIDPRLSAEMYKVYTITNDPKRIERYKQILEEDMHLKDDPCSLKSTTHMAMGVASDVTLVLTNFFANLEYNDDIREIPFCITKSAPLVTYDLILKS